MVYNFVSFSYCKDRSIFEFVNRKIILKIYIAIIWTYRKGRGLLNVASFIIKRCCELAKVNKFL